MAMSAEYRSKVAAFPGTKCDEKLQANKQKRFIYNGDKINLLSFM